MSELDEQANLPLDDGGQPLSAATPGHVEDQLAAYTGGELSAFERAAVERHLASCPACRAALAEVRRIRMLLASLASPLLADAPGTLADVVLAALPGAQDDGLAATPARADEPAGPGLAPQGTACPVSPDGGVPPPVLRLEPRYARGRLSPSGRRWEGATGRDATAMERSKPTAIERPARPGMPAASDRRADAHYARGGRLRSFAAVVAAVAVIALGVGIFGVISHRPAPTTASVGGQPGATATAGQAVTSGAADLPANSTLDAVSMDSPTDGWAVGTVYNAANGMGGSKNVLLAHYDGRTWSASPDSANFKVGYLVGVSMDSADDGWAVGSSADAPGGTPHGLVLHYTGGRWRAVDISATGFAGGGAVHMRSADDGWIYAPAGEKTNADHKTLILHYQHGAWSLFSSIPGTAVVAMLSTDDGWAASTETNAILHYHNGQWTQVATASGQPLAMSAASSSEVWLGGLDVSTQSAFAMRYDGQSWAPLTLPEAAHAEIDQIAVAAPGEVWMLGQDHSTLAAKTAAWHYGNGRWTRVTLDFRAAPTGASMASATSGWITGNAAYNTAALMRYDNGAWTAVYYGK